MAAEIKPAARNVKDKFCTAKKPQLLDKLEGCSDERYAACLIPGEDGVIGVSDDLCVKVWLKRGSGKYWPSIRQLLNSKATSLYYCVETRHLFIGQENGTVSEYSLAADFNSMQFIRDYLVSHGRVTDVYFAIDCDWVLAASRDKTFACHCTQRGHLISRYVADAWCIKFDSQTKHAFIGTESGDILVVQLHNDGLTYVTSMKGHTKAVKSLSWDPERQLLFSCSADQSVRIWDLQGRQGTVYELHGHDREVSGVAYLSSNKQLISAGEDGVLVLWDTTKSRKPAPEWLESDTCQLCDRPFFWNIKAMMDQRQLGLRQHHCRSCAKAVCDRCSQYRLEIPYMGFEFNVRVCDPCHVALRDVERPSMATFHDAVHSIVSMDLDETHKRMITVGKDHLIKVWDISDLL